jgi:hypothetical protein
VLTAGLSGSGHVARRGVATLALAVVFVAGKGRGWIDAKEAVVLLVALGFIERCETRIGQLDLRLARI